MANLARKGRPAPETVDASILSFEQTKKESYRRDGMKHTNVYYKAVFLINGHKIDAKLHQMSDDGTIKRNKGKVYVSFEGNVKAKKKADKKMEKAKKFELTHTSCPVCCGEDEARRIKTTGAVAVAISNLIRPVLKKMGYEMATWNSPGNWWLFDMNARIVKGSSKEVGSWMAGPELAIVQYRALVDCPIHGKVAKFENEPID